MVPPWQTSYTFYTHWWSVNTPIFYVSVIWIFVWIVLGYLLSPTSVLRSQLDVSDPPTDPQHQKKCPWGGHLTPSVSLCHLLKNEPRVTLDKMTCNVQPAVCLCSTRVRAWRWSKAHRSVSLCVTVRTSHGDKVLQVCFSMNPVW